MDCVVGRTVGICPGNAFWSPTTLSINFCEEEGEFANTAEIANIVYHEYGHALTQFLYEENEADQPPGRLHEGNSDILANWLDRNAETGLGYYLDVCDLGIRTAENSLTWPDDVYGTHFAGQIIAGFHWHAWENLLAVFPREEADDVAFRTWHHGRAMGAPRTFPDQVFWTFLLDDDDGSLGNGSPHFRELCEAAERHGFRCPDAFVNIKHAPLPHTTTGENGFEVLAEVVGISAPLEPQAARVHYRVNGAAWRTTLLEPTGDRDTHRAFIPPVTGQESSVEYFLEARDVTGNRRLEPGGGALAPHAFDVAWRIDDLEGDVSGWTVGAPDDDATGGIWELADPEGTPAQPEDDATPGAGRMAFITGQCAPPACDLCNNQCSDVDDGQTTLVSPVWDLRGMLRARLRFDAWYTNVMGNAPLQDEWIVDVSNDGGLTWTNFLTSRTPAATWKTHDVDLNRIFGKPGRARLRFRASDRGEASIIEAGVDDVRVLARSLNRGQVDWTEAPDGAAPSFSFEFSIGRNVGSAPVPPRGDPAGARDGGARGPRRERPPRPRPARRVAPGRTHPGGVVRPGRLGRGRRNRRLLRPPASGRSGSHPADRAPSLISGFPCGSWIRECPRFRSRRRSARIQEPAGLPLSPPDPTLRSSVSMRCPRMLATVALAAGLASPGPVLAFTPPPHHHDLEFPLEAESRVIPAEFEKLDGLAFGRSSLDHSWRVQRDGLTGYYHFVYGHGLTLGGSVASEAEAATAVRSFLLQHPDVLGTRSDNMELRNVAQYRGKYAVHYRQQVAGIPVFRASAFTVVGESGEVMAFGSGFLPGDENLSAQVSLSESDAVKIAADALGTEPRDDRGVTTEKYWVPAFGEEELELRLAYQVIFESYEPFGKWATFVDAQSGALLGRENHYRFVNVTGNVEADVDDYGYCDGNGFQPVKGMTVNVSGGNSDVTDENGDFDISHGGSGDVTVTSEFLGPYINVNRYAGLGADATFSGTFTPGAPEAISWDTASSRWDERDCFFHGNRVHDLMLAIDPTFTQLDYAMPTIVGRNDGFCPGNAWWDGTGMNYCRQDAGAGYANTGRIGNVIYHEYRPRGDPGGLLQKRRVGTSGRPPRGELGRHRQFHRSQSHHRVRLLPERLLRGNPQRRQQHDVPRVQRERRTHGGSGHRRLPLGRVADDAPGHAPAGCRRPGLRRLALRAGYGNAVHLPGPGTLDVHRGRRRRRPHERDAELRSLLPGPPRTTASRVRRSRVRSRLPTPRWDTRRAASGRSRPSSSRTSRRSTRTRSSSTTA